MKQDQAETIALQALGWLADQQDFMRVFLANSGADINTLMENAGDPDFLGSVLDFILSSDEIVSGFCDAYSLDYDLPSQVRQLLPGGQAVNWT